MLRFLLESVYPPNVRIDLQGIYRTECVTPVAQGEFEDSTVNAFSGFATPGVTPSATRVKALRISDWTAKGNSSKSLRAALIQDIGLVGFI